MSLSVTRRQKLSRTPDPRFNRGDGKAVTPVMASLRERCSSKGTRDSCRPASRHRVFDERPRRTQILIANSEILPSSVNPTSNISFRILFPDLIQDEGLIQNRREKSLERVRKLFDCYPRFIWNLFSQEIEGDSFYFV